MRKLLSSTPGRFALVALLVTAPALAATMFAPLTGAIFTTTANGSRVNANIYASKSDVYLDGGPGQNAPATAAGLPDGHYYFQVTDPSGQVLLSTDAVRFRQFEVSGGLILSVSGDGNHLTGVDQDHGAATIQLLPYADTPNNGGVYKVWVTRIEDFSGDPTIVDNGYAPGYFHGFIPAFSKVDVFKVRRGNLRLPCLKVIVFKDVDEDGVMDSGDYDWGGVPVTVVDPLGAQLIGPFFTGYNGAGLNICDLLSGVYRVSATLLPENPITGATLDGTPVPYVNGVSVPMENRDRVLHIGFANCWDM